MKEEVKHPSRYNQGGIEFWDVEKAFFGMDSHIDHLVQSALEYGVRFRRKNGAEDLRKGANLLNVAADLLDGKAEAEPRREAAPVAEHDHAEHQRRLLRNRDVRIDTMKHHVEFMRDLRKFKKCGRGRP